MIPNRLYKLYNFIVLDDWCNNVKTITVQRRRYILGKTSRNVLPYLKTNREIIKNIQTLPRSHGATHSFSLALFKIVSGKGRECLTIAPYRPYSAIIVLLPQHFSVLRHFALLFWNHTYKKKLSKLFHDLWSGVLYASSSVVVYKIDRSGKQQKRGDWNIRLAVNPPTDPIPDAVMSCYCCNQSEERRTAVWLVHHEPFNGYTKPQITPHQKLPNGVNCDLYIKHFYI